MSARTPSFKLSPEVTYINRRFLRRSSCHSLSERGDGKVAQLALFTGNLSAWDPPMQMQTDLYQDSSATSSSPLSLCHLLLPSAPLPAASPVGLFHTCIGPSTSTGSLSAVIFIPYSVHTLCFSSPGLKMLHLHSCSAFPRPPWSLPS